MIELAPVNLLVGENSSGKSTILSLAKLSCDFASSRIADFNSRPFLLGSYDEIAFNIGGVAGRAASFILSFEIAFDGRAGWMGPIRLRDEKTIPRKATISVKFTNRNSQPKVTMVELGFEDHGSVEVDSERKAVEFKMPSGRTIKHSIAEQKSAPWNESNSLVAAWFALTSLPEKKEFESDKALQTLLELGKIALLSYDGGMSAYAALPIRSQPRRTYDPVTSSTLEDSNYALQSLASLKRTKNAEWESLKKTLSSAGDTAGLFKDFEIRLLGKNESDPFQAQVKIGSKKVNLVDVGFGVSQVIPALYDLLVVRTDFVLMQQPEIHLHPKAQAGLGALIAQLPESRKKQKYLIETHSDYLIDAISIAIRSGRAKPEDFRVLFCERIKTESTVHQLKFDESGQLVAQPNSYREFFLRHQGDLFGLN